jgi:hypothetical protein
MTDVEDKLDRISAVLADHGSHLEALGVQLKHNIAEIMRPGIAREPGALNEQTFNVLKFEAQSGAKLGEYEVAHKANNPPDAWQVGIDKWTYAYNVLEKSKATIDNRYHGEGYVFAYWLFGEDKIYRQKLKAKQ